MGFSYEEIKENFGPKSRSTGQTAYRRFRERTLMWGKTSRPGRRAQRKKENLIV